MRLYLSSYRIPEPQALYDLVGKSASSIRVAIIPNAKDYYAPRPRNSKLQEATNYLQDMGITSEVVDLTGYSNSVLLQQTLSSFDCMWAIGGNTFCLRYEMRRSGFEQIIGEVLNSVVYIGESAGACVVGTTLKGLEAADPPEFVEEVIWEGLSLLPNIISPHADSVVYSDAIEHVRQLYKNDSSLIELTDAQVLVVNGNEQKILPAANV